jgi:hypothetical protein
MKILGAHGKVPALINPDDDDGMASLLTPGMFVENPNAPEWGRGQVQSNIKGRVTVNFEDAGKVVIDARKVTLTIIHNP